MRTINRKIVGAFIFSSDDKILLGHNKKGGTYQGMLVIPGGGIEEGETELEAVKREILEETGVNLASATITQLDNVATGESEKTLKDTNEVVLMKMQFFDFTAKLNETADQVSLRFDDDFGDAQWYSAEELRNAQMGPNTKLTLQKLGFLAA